MRLYEVRYCRRSDGSDEYTVNVTASNPLRAIELVNKGQGSYRSKFVGYSGRVVQVLEVRSNVHIAK